MAFTFEQIQKQASLPVADQQAQAGTKVADTPGFNPSAPINSSTLTPATPVVLPPAPTPSTVGAGVIAGANQNVADVNAQAAANVKASEEAAGVGQAQSQTNSMLASIKDLFNQKATTTQDVMTNSPEAQQKAVEMKTLNDLNTEIADTTVKLRGEQDAIKGRGDITKEAQSGLLQNVNDKYGRSLADLAIRQSAASGNITRLESSLKDALALKLAPLEADLEYYKDYGLKNLENLSKQEQDRLTAIISEKKNLVDQTRADQETMAGALKTASANGVKIPDAVVKQMQDNPAQSYSILASNGITLQDPLEKQIKQANLANIYSQIEDRKATALAKATELPGPVQTRVQGIAGQFDSEQAVKAFQTSAEAIDAVKNAGVSPTDDISRVYAFAKVMDPNSVVREGEYKTVQDYSTALIQRAGLKANRIFNNDGFLTDEARKFMLTTLENRLASSKKAYDNIYNSYGERINKVTGKADGKEYITDYSAAFSTAAPSTTTTKSGKPFDVTAAKAAGYTQAEIDAYLNSN